MNIEELMKRSDITMITDKLFLSGSILDYNTLKELGITAVINMKSEQHDDIYELTKREISYFWVPVSDHTAPRIDQIDSCMRIIKKFDKVLVHCAVGRGRSAMVTAAWLLVDKKFLTIEQCIDYITKKRPSVALTDIQYRKLCNYVTIPIKK